MGDDEVYALFSASVVVVLLGIELLVELFVGDD